MEEIIHVRIVVDRSLADFAVSDLEMIADSR